VTLLEKEINGYCNFLA